MSAITAKASRKMKKYAVLTREPRCFLGSFDFSWEQRKVQGVADRFDNLRIPVAANLRVHGTRRIMVQTEFRIMWRDLHTMENLSLLLKMERMT